MFRLSPATASASREFFSGDDLLRLFERLRADPLPWLLDSALPSARLGRHSFAGSAPYLVLRAWGTQVEIDCRRDVRPGLAVGRTVIEADPLEVVRALMPPAPERSSPSADDVPFIGGAVGSLGYELVERIEALDLGAADDLGLPDLQLLFVDRLLSHDSLTGRHRVHALGFGETAVSARERAEAAADQLLNRLAAPNSETPPQPTPAASARPSFAFFDADSYAKAVDAAKQEIAVGNAYQVCLTQRMEWDHAGDPWSLYRSLRVRNPAPFAAYFEFPEVAVIGSSPERFLRLDPNREVESRPIKGTRPRGSDENEDRANRARLECSAKDRAENLMIVDLVRNDLGRVCETGSIDVPELMAIEAYAAVFQMVSTVRGKLCSGRDAVDLIRATFPPGSMTGAPKIAAMNIIDELEPVRRGIYSGAMGYLDVRGGLDLCVAIRTILLCGRRALVHAGGGIVADSDPLAEWRESLDKAAPLVAALESRDE